MKKRTYKAEKIKDIEASGLLGKHDGSRLVVGVDVAKEVMFAAVMNEAGAVLTIVKWSQPKEHRLFIGMVEQLRQRCPVEVVMEPTGSYGDALLDDLRRRGFAVYRMEAKRAHDARELYDGVPSLHDAKAATLLCRLHLSQVSRRWQPETESQRKAKALLFELSLYRKQFANNRNRLESLLSRYFPELDHLLLLRSVTLLELMSRYGGPRAIVADEAGARALMEQTGGALLSSEKIDAVLEAARNSIGAPQLAEERSLVETVAEEVRRNQQQLQQRERLMRKLSKHEPAAQPMRKMVGPVTAAVLLAVAGDPRSYGSAKAYQKALGLNLRERSSGKKQGALHLSKRGPSLARAYLYLCALRMVHRNPIVRSWYDQKVARQGGQGKIKAITAVMRKLTLALFHVAQGRPFDAAKLFDSRRLPSAPGDKIQPSTLGVAALT